MILNMIMIARGVLTGHESFHLPRGGRKLEHEWIGVLICHILIHHLLWRWDSMILSKAHSNWLISHDATLPHNLLRRVILIYTHLWIVRGHCHHLAIWVVLLDTAWRWRLIYEACASILILGWHWLRGRWHHHLMIIHIAGEIVFNILLHLIGAWNHSCLSKEGGAAITWRSDCVWQLLMMLMQERLVCVQKLMLLAVQAAVCSC